MNTEAFLFIKLNFHDTFMGISRKDNHMPTYQVSCLGKFVVNSVIRWSLYDFEVVQSFKVK